MTIPMPALLAMIVLLLWPAARLWSVVRDRAAVQSSGNGGRPGDAARSMRMEWSVRATVVAATTVAAHFLVLAAILLALWALQLGVARLQPVEPMILGAIPLGSLLRFMGVVQFAAFTGFAAIETRRALHVEIADRPFVKQLDWRKLVGNIRTRLVGDLPVYLSIPVFSVAIILLLVAANLGAKVAAIPA